MTTLLLTVLGVMIFFFFIASVFIVFYIQHKNKKAVQGRVYGWWLRKEGGLHKELVKAENGTVKPSKNSGIEGEYTTRLDREYRDFYPPTSFIKFFQVPCSYVYWAENDSEPIHPFSVTPLVSAQQIEQGKSEKFARVMSLMQEDTLGKIDTIMRAMKLNPRVLYLLLFSCLASGLFNFMIVYMVYTLLKAYLTAQGYAL